MKASGSLSSLVQGVSQQSPQDRRDGQLGEMINMIPDPVNGPARRHGSKWVSEVDLGINPSLYDTLVADTESYRAFEYNNAGSDFVLLYRSATRPAGSTLAPFIVYNKGTGAFLNVVRPVADAVLDQFSAGGCSAITSIGKYVFAAGHTVVPTASTDALWAAASNQDKTVVWVRGGGYSRTFKVTVTKTDNSAVSFEYTTPKSSYDGVLDTSKVPSYSRDPAGGTETKNESAFIELKAGLYKHTLAWGDWAPASLTARKSATLMTNTYPVAPSYDEEYSWNAGDKEIVFHSSNEGATDVTLDYTATKTVFNPNYAQIVARLTNEYNSAVTRHIGQAAEAIQPQAIAEQLRLAAVAAGLTGATRQDSTIIIEGVKAVTVQDGGDGSLVRGVANEVASADQVSNIHIIGKVVRVRARGSEEVYYLKATAKDQLTVSGYAEVTWVEGAGISYSINDALIYGVASGGTFYMASSATMLNSILPGAHPTYTPSGVGDNVSSPLPFFIGRKISYLGVFQDRLLVGCGGVIRASKTGDYLNFFRTSVLTAPADDAFEMLSQGSEDDELRHSVLYDRDLVLFGAKRQYAVSGRSMLGPTNPNMPVMSSHDGAADTVPIAAGGLIFYSKQGTLSPSLHEIRPGNVAESPESFLLSSQLSTYFKGKATEIATISNPTMVFLSTAGARHSVYPFTYMDTSQGRRQDAWGRWDFAEELGAIVSMVGTVSALLLFTIRVAHGKTWVVADSCPLDAGLAEYPYLDSIRPWATVAANTGSLRASTPGDWAVAFDSSTEYRFIGADLADRAKLLADFPLASGLWAGAKQHAEIIPTNPFVRDRKDNAVTIGRLTVTKLAVSFERSSGCNITIKQAGTGAVLSDTIFNGHVVGSPFSFIGRVPVTSGSFSVPIGKETRDYVLSLKARTWLPFNPTSIEWVGQFFSNTQRL